MEAPVTLRQLNTAPAEEASAFLAETLFSSELGTEIVRHRPFQTLDGLCTVAAATWNALSLRQKHATFDAHPRIGDIEAVKQRQHSRKEQEAICTASPETISALALLNAEYEKTFGYRFIVFARGKTAGEMKSILEERLKNTPEKELEIASHEKLRINESRLRKQIQETRS